MKLIKLVPLVVAVFLLESCRGEEIDSLVKKVESHADCSGDIGLNYEVQYNTPPSVFPYDNTPVPVIRANCN